MVDEEQVLRGLAKYYRFRVGDLEEARRILDLRSQDFAVRFMEVVRFSNRFGVSPVALARFVARSTKGIKRWRRPAHIKPLTDEERQRLKEAVPDGDWARVVLRLLDQ